ncbi:MAG: aldehyde ferredoxin oxidoreductase family protein [Sporomusaceae bacterium]|nr:aldehyde ferredoxin oxidoreductase family protein [Sporomusaceae bacterium]
MKGYHNCFLYVDLTSRTTAARRFPEEMLRQYIGGAGLGARILYDGTGPDTDPLGPDNLLCLLTGPITGTKITGTGRHSAVFKSPLTRAWGEASVGGTWGRELKRAGYDGVIIRGRAEKPVYLWINDSTVEFRDAGEFWGLDTYETDAALRQVTDADAVVSCIGPAGENLALISGIFTDGIEGRAAARCGVGAVQGSKNLKAVVVHGSGEVPVFDQDGLDDDLKGFLPDFIGKTGGLKNFGTAGLVLGCEQTGDFPVKNWQKGKWEEGAAKISGPAMKESITKKNYYCAGCVVGCGRHVAVETGPYAQVKGGGPEYETLGLIGGSCLVDDLEVIAKANELCNRYGLDTIEVGNAVAMAMEAYERGLISETQAGLKLEWGNGATVIALIHQMGKNIGFGAVLNQGLVRAAKAIGGAVECFAMHSKGVSLPAHDPRAYTSIALGYATSPRGACHLQAFSHAYERALSAPDLGIDAPLERFTAVGKADLVIKLQNFMALFDSLCICKFDIFGGIGVTILTNWYRKVTGVEMAPEELLIAGERIFNLKRQYNINCGLDVTDDTLPDRILHQARGEGGAADNLPDLAAMLPEYYTLRGWDDKGKPKAELLTRLAIG